MVQMKEYFQKMRIYTKSIILPFLVLGGILIGGSIGLSSIQNRWGLQGQYYTNTQWEREPAVSRIDNVLSLREEDGNDLLSTNKFSIKWTGWIHINRSGTYQFATDSDDGSYIRINGQTIVDNGGAHGLKKVSHEIHLIQGVYPIEILYFQIGGYGVMQALWHPPGETEELIPAQVLFSEHPRQRDLLFRKGVIILVIFLKIAWMSLLLILCWISLKRLKKTKIPHYKKSYVGIGCIIVVIFGISSNIAWLNPPRYSEVKGNKFVKLSETIPFMWQFHGDSRLEVLSAANFPAIFKNIPIRINRPVYPMIVHYLSRVVAFFSESFVFLTPLHTAIIGYILLKLCVYGTGAILMYHLLLPYYNYSNFWSGYAVALTFFHKFSIEYIATYHTTELQFISPIIILYLFDQLVRSYSFRRNVIFSLIVGVLMLAKQNYAIYLAVLLYALLYRRFKEVLISVSAHFIPLLLWLGFLHIYGLEYYNHEAVVYSQGVWLYQEFIHLDILQMIQIVLNFVNSYLVYAIKHYSVWLFLAFLAWGGQTFARKKEVSLLLLLCMSTTWLQWFAARRYDPYMTADFSIFIFGMATMLLRGTIKKKSLLYGIMVLWVFVSILSFVRFPWVHPYNQ